MQLNLKNQYVKKNFFALPLTETCVSIGKSEKKNEEKNCFEQFSREIECFFYCREIQSDKMFQFETHGLYQCGWRMVLVEKRRKIREQVIEFAKGAGHIFGGKSAARKGDTF